MKRCWYAAGSVIWKVVRDAMGGWEGVQSRQRELSASAAIAARRDELHEAGNLLGGETRSANDGDVGVWKILSDEDLWAIAAFVYEMKRLPAGVEGKILAKEEKK